MSELVRIAAGALGFIVATLLVGTIISYPALSLVEWWTNKPVSDFVVTLACIPAISSGLFAFRLIRQMLKRSTA